MEEEAKGDDPRGEREGAESTTVCSDCLKKQDRDPGDPSLQRVSPKVSAIRTAAERSILASNLKEVEEE